MMVRALHLFTLLLVTVNGYAQISFGIFGGLASVSTKDPYALDNQWPLLANTQEGYYTVFFSKGTGSAVGGFVNWEATPIFSMGAVYRSYSFTMSENKRSGGVTSLGLQFRVNLVRNTKKVVPFVQAEFMFMNRTQMTQNKATSPIYATQVQPAFDAAFSSNLGLGGDLGAEIKLSGPFSLLVTAGVHGVQINSGDEDSALVQSLPYAPHAGPQSFGGYTVFQLAAGIKYYTGRNTKKRDF